ncbi:MAG: hypothetical protein ACKVOQ_22450 [Cyclobacteriaceae bacterium]
MKTKQQAILIILLIAPTLLYAQKLSIANTEFKSLKAAYAHKEEAAWLDLSNRGLTALPDSVFDLPKLQYLDLSKNHIEAIPAAMTASHLCHLLSGNSSQWNTFSW